MSLPPPRFDHYEQRVAEAMLGQTELLTAGLPGFLGIRHLEMGKGTLTAELDVRDDLKTPFGTLHGGVVSALVDHVLGSVLYPVMPSGYWAATTDFKINLIGPARAGVLRATAEIVAMTKRTAVVRIDVVCEDRAVAAAQGTVTIQPPK